MAARACSPRHPWTAGRLVRNATHCQVPLVSCTYTARGCWMGSIGSVMMLGNAFNTYTKTATRAAACCNHKNCMIDRSIYLADSSGARVINIPESYWRGVHHVPDDKQVDAIVFFIFLIRSFWFRIFFCDTQKLSALCWPGIGWCSLSYKMCNIIMIICALKTTIWLWWLVQLLLLLLLMVVLCGTCAMLGWAPLMLSNSDGVEHEPRCRPGPLGWSSIRAVPQYRYRKNYTTAVFVTC